MRNGLFALFFVVGLLSGASFFLPGTTSASGHDITERWLGVNHLQLLVDGEWEDVKLIPLAEHMCQTDDPIYRRYCE